MRTLCCCPSLPLKPGEIPHRLIVTFQILIIAEKTSSTHLKNMHDCIIGTSCKAQDVQANNMDCSESVKTWWKAVTALWRFFSLQRGTSLKCGCSSLGTRLLSEASHSVCSAGRKKITKKEGKQYFTLNGK